MIEEKRIYELAERINKRKEGADSEAATYRDIPDLKELLSLLRDAKPAGEEEEKLLFDAYEYLSTQYETLVRLSVAGVYRQEALTRAGKFESKLDFEKLSHMAYRLLKCRNFYVDDDCEDIRPLLNKLLGEDYANEQYEDLKNLRRPIKNDPVEMSEAYLKVIDEVEEKIDKNLTYRGMGSCFEYWDLKREYLAEKGIAWKSPRQLNPNTHFD